MAHLHESMAALRIMGDDLVPSEITKLLGCEPTKEHVKGQKFRSSSRGLERIAKTGMWRLIASDCQPENLDGQISEILNKLNSDLSVWKQLAQKYTLDLFCGFYMKETNEGLIISPEAINSLGERGIAVSIDIYAPLDE